MTGKELAEYCKKLYSDCDTCEHKDLCEKFNEYTSEYAPFVLLESDKMIKHLLEHEF